MTSTVKRQLEKIALLWGVGYVVRGLIPALHARGYTVYGTTRQAERLRPMQQNLGITPVLLETNFSSYLSEIIQNADIILVSVAPENGGDAYAKTLGKLAEAASYVGYFSATSVYGDRGGQWVFEDEWLRPSLERGRARVEAELAWLETGLPVHVFRLAGIYGPNIKGMVRNPLQRVMRPQAKAVIKPGHVTNRIHVQDIAGAVIASLDKRDPMQVYNLADDYPAPPQDVLRYAAELCGREPLAEVDWQSAEMSDMARSFYRETKRVSNQKAKTDLGWTPLYPDYKTGLNAIWKEMRS